MSTLLESLPDAVSERGEGWVLRAAEEARRLARLLPPDGARAAEAIVQVLDEHRAELARGSGGTLAVVVSHLALGSVDAAERAWLEETATVEEILEAEGAAVGALESANAARAATWATWRRVAETVLRVGGQAAVPLLLSIL